MSSTGCSSRNGQPRHLPTRLESTVFTYRPHVHQLDGTITPDLLIDRLVVDGHEVPDMLSDRVVLSGCGMTCVPAVVLIAAGCGTLIGLGFVFTTADQGPARLCLIGRAAWRLADVSPHAQSLQLDLRWQQDGVEFVPQGVPGSGRWADPSRGVAACWTEPAWHVPRDARWCSVGLQDPIHQRVLTHRFALSSSPD